MSYCINPDCDARCNQDNLKHCLGCGSELIIRDRYRLMRPLRTLNGQHQTEIFEVDDLGITKILKVLTTNRRLFVKLFEREGEILKQLESLPVPQLDDRFTFMPKNSRKKLRCIVMEKVEGQDLEQWTRERGKLSESLAIDWLRQLLTILLQVHFSYILHRDLKPSNIMIRPDGKLIAIDFGTARKLTVTYVEKLRESHITNVYSKGYTAPEQQDGKAVVQSDLFALGRTFVHLMTGICPDHLPKAENKELIWHQYAPQISSSLKSLIDRLLISCPERRPSKSEIIEQLDRIENISTATKIWQKDSLKNWQSIVAIALSSLAIWGLIVGIRYLGWLQPLELSAYDRLIQLRPNETPDDRLLLITIDEGDIQYQNQQNMSLRWSLSDEALAQLLMKIKPYQPRTIGIDIYRDFAVDSNYPELARELATSDRLYAVCKVPAPLDGTPEGTPPPPEVTLDRIGFSDLVADSGDIVRRQLLHLVPPADSNCTTEYAFSLQLALDYLAKEKIESEITSDGYLQIGTTSFKPLEKHSGGYQNLDAAGYQIMLNYRTLNSPRNIARQISLKDVLGDRTSSQLKNLIQNRLIIIGVVASSSTDDWQTPYSKYSPIHKQIPGVFLQAQMTSQIINAVLNERPLIWWWSTLLEVIWIAGWSLLGAILGWYLHYPLWLASGVAFSLLLLFASCWATFTYAGWIPLIPSAIVLFLASAATAFLRQRLSKLR